MRSPIFSLRTLILAIVLVVLCGFVMVDSTEAGQKVTAPTTPTIVDAANRVVGAVIGRTSPAEAPALFEAVALVRIGDSAAIVRVTPSEITGFLPHLVGVQLAFSGQNCTGTAYVYDQRTTSTATFGGIALTDGVNLYVPKPQAGVVLDPLPPTRWNPNFPNNCEPDAFGGTYYVETLTVPLSTVNSGFTPPFAITGLRTLP